jgi:integrase
MALPTKFRFTQRTIDQLPAHRADASSKSAEYSDADVVGLRIVVNKQGRKYFYFRFTFLGVKRVAKIGEYPAIPIQEARRKALDMRADIDRGVDPTEAKEHLLGIPTFEDFAYRDYMPYAEANKRSAKDDLSKLRVHLVPKFGPRRLCDIPLRDIQAYHGQVKRSHCAATANRHLSVLSKMFKCAIQWGVVTTNPCSGVTKFPENNVKQRFLTPDEIRRLYAVMEIRSHKSPVMVAVLKFLLLTGVRRNEALTAQWKDVDLDNGNWFIQHTKSGKARYVILNEEAKSVLAGLPRPLGSPWVFPGKDTSKHLVEPRKCLDQLAQEAGIEGLRIHDLRHSFASLCAQSGASLLAIKDLLGHGNVVTTQRYTHLSVETQRHASQSVSDAVHQALK